MSEDLSGFKTLKISLKIHLHPSRLGLIHEGVAEILNQYLMSYDPTLGGVVLAYSDVELQAHTGKIFYARSHIHFPVHAKVLLFAPSIGEKLVGEVNKIAQDHIGLLVRGVFNVSIRSDSIPKHYSYDAKTESWISSHVGKNPIEVGSSLSFTVTGLQHQQSFFSMKGSLVNKKVKQEAEPVDHHATVIPNSTDVDKKRKRDRSSLPPAPSSPKLTPLSKKPKLPSSSKSKKSSSKVT